MPIDNDARDRRRACLPAHFQAENQHVIPSTSRTFAETTEMIFNGQIFRTHDQIAQAHTYSGFSGDGAPEGLSASIDCASFTDDEVMFESRLVGEHVREYQGFSPLGRLVALSAVGI